MCQRAAWVHIDPSALDVFAARLAAEVAEARPHAAPSPTDPWSFTGPPDQRDSGGRDADEQLAALVLTLAAVNFGSGWHPRVRKLPGCSGAVTMATHWRAKAPGAGLLDAAGLTAFSPGDAAALFEQPTDDAEVMELMGLFAASLCELATHVTERHAGSFLALAASAEHRAPRIAEELGALPHFDDRCQSHGREVSFYKRAQLAAADLHRAFPDRHPGPFHDVDRLTAFADNLVPHVLRIEGVLRYEPELVARIRRGELLAPGSPEEVEIRAAGVQAVELLVASLADAGVAITAADLDAILWRRGGRPESKAEPRHRTKSWFY